MYELIKNALNEEGLKGSFTTSLGENLSVYIPIEELKYKLENDGIPILMQEIPGLIQLARFIYEMNMSLFQVKSKEDVILYAIGVIFGFLRNKTDGFIDTELFFELLEDFLILFMNVKEVETIIFSQRLKKDKKIIRLKKFNYLKNIYNLIDDLSMFKIASILSKMRVRNSEIGMLQVEKLIKVINYYKNLEK